MSFEPETSICPSCKRQGCASPESYFDDDHNLVTTWICKCGEEIRYEVREGKLVGFVGGMGAP